MYVPTSSTRGKPQQHPTKAVSSMYQKVFTTYKIASKML